MKKFTVSSASLKNKPFLSAIFLNAKFIDLKFSEGNYFTMAQAPTSFIKRPLLPPFQNINQHQHPPYQSNKQGMEFFSHDYFIQLTSSEILEQQQVLLTSSEVLHQGFLNRIHQLVETALANPFVLGFGNLFEKLIQDRSIEILFSNPFPEEIGQISVDSGPLPFYAGEHSPFPSLSSHLQDSSSHSPEAEIKNRSFPPTSTSSTTLYQEAGKEGVTNFTFKLQNPSPGHTISTSNISALPPTFSILQWDTRQSSLSQKRKIPSKAKLKIIPEDTRELNGKGPLFIESVYEYTFKAKTHPVKSFDNVLNAGYSALKDESISKETAKKFLIEVLIRSGYDVSILTDEVPKPAQYTELQWVN